MTEVRDVARTLDDPAELATIACGFANVYVIPGRYDDAEKELATAARHLARLHGEEIGAPLDRVAATGGEVDPALVESIEHADARLRISHARPTSPVATMGKGLSSGCRKLASTPVSCAGPTSGR